MTTYETDTVKPAAIDLWNVGTFDPKLIVFLEKNTDLIQAYVDTEKTIFLEHDYGPGRANIGLRPSNPHTAAYYHLIEILAKGLQSRSIRAFHYTRLTDNEVATIRKEGIHLSTPTTMRHRLAECVSAGYLTVADLEAIIDTSPFYGQLDIRADKFCLTSHPVTPDKTDVSDLLGHWGGEVVYTGLKAPRIIEKLRSIGKARIVEVTVPISVTRDGLNASKSIISAFARSIGCIESKHAIDIYVRSSLPATAILAIHSEGDEDFASMGQGYPKDYIDVSETYWKELTGDD